MPPVCSVVMVTCRTGSPSWDFQWSDSLWSHTNSPVSTSVQLYQCAFANNAYPSAILQRYSRWSSRSGTSVKSAQGRMENNGAQIRRGNCARRRIKGGTDYLPAPLMLAPLKEVFPVASAPSKLAFVKFVYVTRKFISV
jgi:hypothetical protein